MSSVAAAYPATLEVSEAAPQGRLGVFFRIILAIPQLIVSGLVVLVAEILTFFAWFVVLFTGRYPASFADFVAGSLRWSTRVNGYTLLLTSQYPPFSLGDEPDYPVRAGFEVALENRNRLTVFFRLIMAIPHVIVLYIIQIVAMIVLFISWIVALFTGSVPAGMHNFLAGFLRYSTRFNAYVWLLTDEYPPFSIS